MLRLGAVTENLPKPHTLPALCVEFTWEGARLRGLRQLSVCVGNRAPVGAGGTLGPQIAAELTGR